MAIDWDAPIELEDGTAVEVLTKPNPVQYNEGFATVTIPGYPWKQEFKQEAIDEHFGDEEDIADNTWCYNADGVWTGDESHGYMMRLVNAGPAVIEDWRL